jgi:autophagy-related protein 2
LTSWCSSRNVVSVFCLLSDESETLLIPGDRDEINSFCDNAMKFSKIQIKVDLPIVSVQLK